MKRALAMIALLSGAATDAPPGPARGGVTEETRTWVERWSLCQRAFITPLLETQRAVPEVVSGAHDACRREEAALRQSLVAAHGPAEADALMGLMKEQTDVIMCGLLRAVRQRQAGTEVGAMRFDTAAQCLRGEVRTTPGNPGGA